MTDTRSTQELLPWLVPLSDGVVACKDSSLLATLEFVGADGDSVGDAETFQIAQAGERLMAAFKDQPVTIWWTLRRERATNYPAEPMPDPVSQLIDDEHRRGFEDSSAFVNRHFLTIIWMPERGAGTVFDRIGRLMGENVPLHKAIVQGVQSAYFGKSAFAWKAAELEMALGEFEGLLAQCSALLQNLNARRLVGSELMGFLHAQANPGTVMGPKNWNGESFFDGLLSEEPISVYRDTLKFGDGESSKSVAMLSLKDWPGLIDFGALQGIMALPCEMVISHCFRVMSTATATKHLHRVQAVNDTFKYPLSTLIFGFFLKKGAMNEAKADATRAQYAAEAAEAKAELTSGRMTFGYHNLSVAIIHRDVAQAEQHADTLIRHLQGSGFVGAVRESIHALSAWATTMPGQWQECRRWMTLSSENCIYSAPLLGVSGGEPVNEYMTGELGEQCQALTVLSTDFNTPYYFNFHVGAVGHAMVIGPTRAGKTIAMNFLMSQMRKYGPLARMIVFDKDHSCRIPILLQDGDYIDLRQGGEVKLNPLHLVKDPNAWTFLSEWVEGLIAARGYQVTAQDAKEIRAAIQNVAARAPDLHRLSTVQTQLPRHLADELAEWVEGGNYGHYVDNVEDSFEVSDFLGVEMGQVMKSPRLAHAVMDYAFYRIQRDLEAQRSGGRRCVTMIYVEECWFLMDDEHFAMRLRDWLKTLGKLGGFVVLTTQSPEDMASLPLKAFAAVRDATLTKLFLPNPMARSSDLSAFYRERLNLRQDTIEQIASAIPKQDYIIVKPDVVRKVRISLTPLQVAALRSETSAQVTFNNYYDPSNPNWKQDYLNAMTGGVQ